MVKHLGRFHISVYHVPGQAVDDLAPLLLRYPSHVNLYWLRSMSVPKPERNQSCWKSFRQLFVTEMPKKGTERAIIDELFEKDIRSSQYK